MKKPFVFLLISILSLFGSRNDIPSKSNLDYWRLVKDKNDIQVYVHKKSKGFNIHRIRATIYTDLPNFIEFLNEPSKYPEWIYGCCHAEEHFRSKDFVVYSSITDLPFPFSNRLLTASSTQELYPTLYISRTISIRPEKVDPKLVPIPYLKSKWIVKAIRPNTLDIDYVVEMDPGGNIPAWLSNLAIDIGPYNTMVNLKNHVEALRS